MSDDREFDTMEERIEQEAMSDDREFEAALADWYYAKADEETAAWANKECPTELNRKQYVAKQHATLAALTRLHALRGIPESERQLMQEDIAAILRILGLGNHARDKSPHEVVQDEILPILESRQQELEAVHNLADAYREERNEARHQLTVARSAADEAIAERDARVTVERVRAVVIDAVYTGYELYPVEGETRWPDLRESIRKQRPLHGRWPEVARRLLAEHGIEGDDND